MDNYLTNKHVKKYVDKLLGKSNENKLVKKCEEKFGKNHDYEKSLEAFYRLPDHISMKYETVDLSK